MPEAELDRILDGNHHLIEMRSQLLASDLSPEGAWIHQYVVRRRYPSGFMISITSFDNGSNTTIALPGKALAANERIASNRWSVAAKHVPSTILNRYPGSGFGCSPPIL